MAETTGDLLTATETAGDGSEQTNWYPDEYKDLVTQRGWTEPAGVLKSYKELDSEMGGRIKMPTPESSAEEVSAFYAKIGRPENPDGYEIKDVPENVPRDEMIESLMRKVAFDSGIPKAAFEAQVKNYFDAMSQSIAQAEAAGDAELQKTWGAAYKANSAIVQRACDELIPDEKLHEEFTDLIKRAGLRNNPVFANVFLGIGTKILDDTLVKGEAGGEEKKDYVPKNVNSPEMYANGDDDESKKARAYFRAKGHVYGRQD
jgi:hypothetical protein